MAVVERLNCVAIQQQGREGHEHAKTAAFAVDGYRVIFESLRVIFGKSVHVFVNVTDEFGPILFVTDKISASLNS